MRRIFAVAAALLLILSCGGCGGSGKDAAARIQAHYANLKTCSMTVDISADYGDRVSSYTVLYEQTAPGEASITVEKPAEIAGITAYIKDGSSSLRYDGMALETGGLAGTALTPIDAAPTMLATWAGGYVSAFSSARYDGVKCWQLTFPSSIDGSAVEQTAWFDEETLKPVHAETSVDGKTVISCDFTKAEWQG